MITVAFIQDKSWVERSAIENSSPREHFYRVIPNIIKLEFLVIST